MKLAKPTHGVPPNRSRPHTTTNTATTEYKWKHLDVAEESGCRGPGEFDLDTAGTLLANSFQARPILVKWLLLEEVRVRQNRRLAVASRSTRFRRSSRFNANAGTAVLGKLKAQRQACHTDV